MRAPLRVPGTDGFPDSPRPPRRSRSVRQGQLQLHRLRAVAEAGQPEDPGPADPDAEAAEDLGEDGRRAGRQGAGRRRHLGRGGGDLVRHTHTHTRIRTHTHARNAGHGTHTHAHAHARQPETRAARGSNTGPERLELNHQFPNCRTNSTSPTKPKDAPWRLLVVCVFGLRTAPANRRRHGPSFRFVRLVKLVRLLGNGQFSFWLNQFCSSVTTNY